MEEENMKLIEDLESSKKKVSSLQNSISAEKGKLEDLLSKMSRTEAQLKASEDFAADLRSENEGLKQDLHSLRTETTVFRDEQERELSILKAAMEKLSAENNQLVQNSASKSSDEAPMSRSMMEELGIEDCTQSPPHDNIVADYIEVGQKADMTDACVQTVEIEPAQLPVEPVQDKPSTSTASIETSFQLIDQTDLDEARNNLNLKMTEIEELKKQLEDLQVAMETEELGK